MTFDEAVELVQDYGAERYSIKRGLLLDSLERLRDDIARCEHDEDLNADEFFVSSHQLVAYRIVCREMRKLFF